MGLLRGALQSWYPTGLTCSELARHSCLSWAYRDGADPWMLWAPLWERGDITQQQLWGGELALAAIWLESNRAAGRFLFPISCVPPLAHKPLVCGSHIIARKQAKVEGATCPLPVSPYLFLISQLANTDVPKRCGLHSQLCSSLSGCPWARFVIACDSIDQL